MAELLDRADIVRVLFYPRRNYTIAFSTPQVRLIDIPIDDVAVNCGRLYPAGATAPTVLFFHGNGEIAADYDTIATLYTQIEINLFVVDYRGYGRSPGTPLSSVMLKDARAVFDALPDILANNGLVTGPLFVMGRSLGSAPAIEVAQYAGQGVSGLIIESGFADTFALVGRLGLRITDAVEERDGFNNPGKISNVKVPTLIIHGEADYLIPPGDGKVLLYHSGAAEKHLELIPGAGHNNLLSVGLQKYQDALKRLVTQR